MMLEVRETPSGSVNNACHLKIGLWKLPPELLLLVLGEVVFLTQVETLGLLQSDGKALTLLGNGLNQTKLTDWFNAFSVQFSCIVYGLK